MKLTYHYEGDYLIPNLIPPESPKIGFWGRRHLDFLRCHRRPLYSGMLMNKTLTSHLEEIDQQAETMFDRLVEQIAAQEGVDEHLKAADQMLWIQKMRNIQNRAEEFVLHDLIFC